MRTRLSLMISITVPLLSAGVSAVAADSPPTASMSRTVVTQPASSEGRLLASNCFQCHGTNGTGGFERITGGEAGEVREYRYEIATKDIMAAHAQGYTNAQLTALVNYLNKIRVKTVR